MAVETPHLQVPFSFDAPNQVEQDSLEDVANCVEAILRYRIGFRTLLLQFGIHDPTFVQGGPNLDEIARAVEEYEPRAGAIIEDLSAELQAAGTIEEAVSVIRVAMEG